MQREHLTDDRAFDLLAKTSQKPNIKVQDIAGWLVAKGNEDARAIGNGQPPTGNPPNPAEWRAVGHTSVRTTS